MLINLAEFGQKPKPSKAQPAKSVSSDIQRSFIHLYFAAIYRSKQIRVVFDYLLNFFDK